ncbi:hypothetical protein TMEN_7603 [Trichophyton mentagrophytes]|nr:hypothetical protein TMEN_7603 [Trichophyton mentagrophytes]
MASDMFSFLLDRPPIGQSVCLSVYLSMYSIFSRAIYLTAIVTQPPTAAPASPPAGDQTTLEIRHQPARCSRLGGSSRAQQAAGSTSTSSSGSGTTTTTTCPPVFPLPRHRLPPVRRIGGRQHAIQARQADHHR